MQLPACHKNRQGFSFAETTLAAMILGLLIIYVFTLIHESNRGTSNAFYQYLAEQVAREPLEVFRFLGANKVAENLGNGISDYRFNEWQKVTSHSVGGIERPEEVNRFERKITLTQLEQGETKAILVQVSVRSAPGFGNSDTGFEQLTRSSIIVKQP